MNVEEIKLAYAISTSSTPRGYMGAVLITDYKGFPLEFQYTDPITPTKIQQVLYGKGLEKYIKVDVILDSLFKVIANSASLVIVQDEDLLRYNTNANIVRVSSTKAAPLGQPGEVSTVKPGEYLLQTSHVDNPVRLKLKPDLSQDSPEFARIKEILTEAGNFIDIAEPLERVYKAVELVWNQEA